MKVIIVGQKFNMYLLDPLSIFNLLNNILCLFKKVHFVVLGKIFMLEQTLYF